MLLVMNRLSLTLLHSCRDCNSYTLKPQSRQSSESRFARSSKTLSPEQPKKCASLLSFFAGAVIKTEQHTGTFREF
jgi:hypothetical protein